MRRPSKRISRGDLPPERLASLSAVERRNNTVLVELVKPFLLIYLNFGIFGKDQNAEAA
jgi:hypothetical protein